METINRSNYVSVIHQLMDMVNRDEMLLESYHYFDKLTKGGDRMDFIDLTPEIAETFDLFLDNLNMEIRKQQNKNEDSEKHKPAKRTERRKSAEPKRTKENGAKPIAKTKALPKKQVPGKEAEVVAHIPSAVGLVRRYIALHGKEKNAEQILSILRAFNKAMVSRTVSTDSPYRKELNEMCTQLKAAAEKAAEAGVLRLELEDKKLEQYRAIATSVERAPSIGLLLEYLNIAWRTGMSERATKLMKRIERATDQGKLDKDPFATMVKEAKPRIQSYLDKETTRIDLPDYTLSGLGSIAVYGLLPAGLSGYHNPQPVTDHLETLKVSSLDGPELEQAFKDTAVPKLCTCIVAVLQSRRKLKSEPSVSNRFDLDSEVLDMRLRNAGKSVKATRQIHTDPTPGLQGLEDSPEGEAPARIISAVDLVQMQFKTIGLQGKYRKLFGDPEPGFSMMIYGKPYEGKSTLAIDLAKELTRLGKTLYASYEEKAGKTLQEKVIRNQAAIQDLDFCARLPSDLQKYRFAFIDSISDARMSELQFKELIRRSQLEQRSIIGIFHANKDGTFKGNQAYEHHVDIVLNIENGIVYSKSRYAPLMEMPLTDLLHHMAA